MVGNHATQLGGAALANDTFGLSDRGRIAPGLSADLLLVNGDPTSEITATRDIAGVWKLGVPVDREGYLSELEAPRTAAESQRAAFAEGEVAVISDFEAGDLTTSFGASGAGPGAAVGTTVAPPAQQYRPF